MADVTQGRYAALVKRLFGIKTDDPARTLNPVVTPLYSLQDEYRPEERALRGEREFSSFQNESVIAGANGFSSVLVGLPALSGQNRLVVIRRLVWSFLLPTSTTQPGNMYLGVSIPFLNPPAILTQANPKDARVAPSVVGGLSSVRLGSQSGQPLLSQPTYAASAIFLFPLFPTAATQAFNLVLDQLNLVLFPNTYVSLDVRSDVNAAAGYSWGVNIEGYERTFDPAEAILPP